MATSDQVALCRQLFTLSEARSLGPRAFRPHREQAAGCSTAACAATSVLSESTGEVRLTKIPRLSPAGRPDEQSSEEVLLFWQEVLLYHMVLPVNDYQALWTTPFLTDGVTLTTELHEVYVPSPTLPRCFAQSTVSMPRHDCPLHLVRAQ